MKHLIHKLISWYLRRCGGAFHCFEYGWRGRYVVLMNEVQYHRYMALANDEKVGEQIMHYRKLMRLIDEECHDE